MTTTAPDGVVIRPAERADLLAVLRIEQASFPQPWPYAAFEGFLGERGFLVAAGDEGAAADGDTPAPVDPRPTNGLDRARLGDVDGGAAGSGEVRGYVVADVVSDVGRRIGHVKDIAVHPDWRGRGIGASLLERALSVLESAGARRAKLEVRVDNRAAQSLYRAFGFAPNQVVPGYYDDGEDALLFVADLTERAAGDG